MKTCTRCNRILPNESFQNGTRQDPQCLDCRRASKAENKIRHPHAVQAWEILERKKSNDPNAFAYAVGQHVASYVDTAINRWEKRTQREAHPNLTAIRDLARKLACEAAASVEIRPGQRRCELCAKPFTPRTIRSRYCTKAHAEAARSKRQLESDPDFNRRKYDKRLAKQGKTRRPPSQPKPPPEPKYCGNCGTELPAGRRKWCSRECWYAVYYPAHRDKYIQRATDRYHRQKAMSSDR